MICTATVVAILFSLGLAAPQASAQTGTNVAVIDIPYIFKNFTRFKQSIDDIKKDIDDYKTYVNDQQKRLREEASKLELYRPGTKEYKDVEETIARTKLEIQLESAKRQKEFMEREAQVYFNAYREVESAVSNFAKRNRIGLVLRYSGEEMDPSQRDSIMQGVNRMVVYQDRLNITEMILEALNRGTPIAQPDGPQIPKRR
jgi:Skp family chaperone for outer membrane proteins